MNIHDFSKSVSCPTNAVDQDLDVASSTLLMRGFSVSDGLLFSMILFVFWGD